MPDPEIQNKQPRSIKNWLKQLGKTTDEELAHRLMGEEPRPDTTLTEGPVSEVRQENSSETETTRTFPGMPAQLSIRKKTANTKQGLSDGGTLDSEEDVVKQRLMGQVQPEEPPESKVRKWLRRREAPKESEPPQSQSEKAEETILGAVPETEKEIFETDLETLRSTAIEGYEPVAIEESPGSRNVFVRFKKWFEKLSLPKKIALIVGALIAVGLIMAAIIFFSASQFQPVATQPTVTYDSPVPIPVTLFLPGGETARLGVGMLNNGSWNPKGAEWLAGTEVPRWVALPWSKKLEGAARNYKLNDTIQLQMSNTDMLFYRFLALQELSSGEIKTFHSNSTDLLIVLSKPGSTTQLVIVAEP